VDKEIAEILLKAKAVTLQPNDPFTFASGIRSPIYCDNRLLLGHVAEREAVVRWMADIIQKKKIDADIIGGTAMAGIPWASWVAEKLEKPMVFVRAEKKMHGKGNIIEGGMVKRKKVLLVEDLISTGTSALASVDTLREEGAEVNDCVAIFTYGFSEAARSFKEHKVQLYPLSNFAALIDAAIKQNYIRAQQKDHLLEWSKDPRKWGTK